MNVNSYYINQKLYMYFYKKNISIIFTLSAFYKSIGFIEKLNNIL